MRDDELGIALFDDQFIQDPYPLYARMHASGPVHPIGDSGFHAVCTWDAVNEAVGRPEDFSSNLTATMTYENGTGRQLRVQRARQRVAGIGDGRRSRACCASQVAAATAGTANQSGRTEYVREVEARLWQEHVRDGRIEWMSVMANRLPMMIVTRLIGVPDVDSDQLMRLGYAGTKTVEGLVSQDELAEAGTAVMELAVYINEHFLAAAEDPEDNLLGFSQPLVPQGI